MPTRTPTLRGDDEVEPIGPAAYGGVGAVITLLIFLYRALATGSIVTRREHENRIADKDKVIADKDAQIAMWKATADTKDAQNAELLEHSRLSVQLMQAIEARSRREDQT